MVDFVRAKTIKMKKEKWYFEGKNLIFYFGWRFDFSFESCGYFDNRPRINICPLFFILTFILPFRNKWKDECDPPKWGIAYHNQTLWIYKGGNGNFNGGNKWWTMDAPWQLAWVRTSRLLKDGTYENEYTWNRLSLPSDSDSSILWKEAHQYTYKLNSGEIQERIATISVEEREWRPKWFKWQSFFKRIRKTIEVDFNSEVGERSGSWKGGCVGCSYLIKDGETPLQCLRRMESERIFS